MQPVYFWQNGSWLYTKMLIRLEFVAVAVHHHFCTDNDQKYPTVLGKHDSWKGSW